MQKKYKRQKNLLEEKMRREKMLFNPGPTNVSDTVRDALKTQDICHREPEFEEVLKRVNNNIVKILGGEGSHNAVLFVSSGTGCNEAIISSIQGKVLIVNNGKYSDRIREIIETYSIPYTEIKFDPLKLIEVKRIEEALVADPTITHIYGVHHETTTGALSPIHEIGMLAKKYNKLFCIDSVSGIGGHPINLQDDNISFCAVSANKGLQSFPGVSFVLGEINAIKATEGHSRSFYFNLFKQWKIEQKGQTMFTPAVQLIYAMDQALKEYLQEGYENRIIRLKSLSRKMAKGLSDLGLEIIEMPEEIRSNILIAIKMPDAMDYWKVHDELKKYGVTIYSDASVLNQRKFRVATLGDLTEADVDEFLALFGKVLKEQKVIS